MDNKFNWLSEPYYRRTETEHAMKTMMIEEYMARHPERVFPPNESGYITARPKDDDRHKFTPVERVTLDYNGRFSNDN